MIKVKERRVVVQEWFETEDSKTGWDATGWRFLEGDDIGIEDWDIVANIYVDKFSNPWASIAEREVEVEE